MKIQNLVESIVRKYNTRDPFQILKEKNVILVYAPLVDVKGFYQFFQRNHIIYIDENLTECEKEIVCAHELGHLFLHKSSNAVFMDSRTDFNTNKYEIEANQFAMSLLIPYEIILENCNLTTEQFSRMLGYEQGLVELRLKSFQDLN